MRTDPRFYSLGGELLRFPPLDSSLIKNIIRLKYFSKLIPFPFVLHFGYMFMRLTYRAIVPLSDIRLCSNGGNLI
jgi:hypothetical protein